VVSTRHLNESSVAGTRIVIVIVIVIVVIVIVIAIVIVIVIVTVTSSWLALWIGSQSWSARRSKH